MTIRATGRQPEVVHHIRAHGSNVSKWCDPTFNALIDKARATANVSERTALYQQAQVVFKQLVPYTPIAHSIVSLPVSKLVKGLAFSPLGSHRFEGVWLE